MSIMEAPAMPRFSNEDEIDEYGYDWRGEVYDEAEGAQQRELEGRGPEGAFSVTVYDDGTYILANPVPFPQYVISDTEENCLRGWLGIR
jgi:hypothetical protein